MTENELTQIARDFLQEHYQLSLEIPVKRNNRLRTSHGRFVLKNNIPFKIELAGYLLKHGTRDVIIGVLKHECIHYAQFKKGVGHLDGDPNFEMELCKHHAPKTKTIMVGKYFEFVCDECGKVTETRRKRIMTHPKQYRTACCGATLTFIKEKIYDGTDKNFIR